MEASSVKTLARLRSGPVSRHPSHAQWMQSADGPNMGTAMPSAATATNRWSGSTASGLSSPPPSTVVWSARTALPCRMMAQIPNPGGHFCGGGSKTKTFIVTREAQFGGKECNHTHMCKESKSCGDCPCPEHCEGHWTEWGACGATCGGSSQSRQFKIDVFAQHGGKKCDHEHEAIENRPCAEVCCPVDCEGEWSEFDQCTEECQDCRAYGAIGTQKQTFHV